MFRYLCLISISTLCTAWAQHVYVWDFTTRERQTTQITKNLTVEFQEALQVNGCLKLLERRQMDAVLAHGQNEQNIFDVSGIDQSLIKALKVSKAGGVIFGELYDDKEDGNYRLQVKVQGFDTEILAISSTRIRRGEMSDGFKRDAYMRKLVARLCASLDGSGIEVISKKKTQKPNKQTITKVFNGLHFVVTKLNKSSSKITCHFKVMSEEEDKRLGIRGYRSKPSTRLFINGHERLSGQVKIGTSLNRDSSTTQYRWCWIDLVSSVWVKGKIEFPLDNSLQLDDEEFVQALEIIGKFAGKNMKLQFRDLPLQ